MTGTSDRRGTRGHLGTWLVVAALGVLLVLALAFVAVGWGADDAYDQAMTTTGYVAMAAGIFFTLALGIGLMSLVFYSNRKGHDRGLPTRAAAPPNRFPR